MLSLITAYKGWFTLSQIKYPMLYIYSHDLVLFLSCRCFPSFEHIKAFNFRSFNHIKIPRGCWDISIIEFYLRLIFNSSYLGLRLIFQCLRKFFNNSNFNIIDIIQTLNCAIHTVIILNCFRIIKLSKRVLD